MAWWSHKMAVNSFIGKGRPLFNTITYLNISMDSYMFNSAIDITITTELLTITELSSKNNPNFGDTVFLGYQVESRGYIVILFTYFTENVFWQGINFSVENGYFVCTLPRWISVLWKKPFIVHHQYSVGGHVGLQISTQVYMYMSQS